jgi:DNA-binding transcriptional regulator YdaS (Cro superfamily)
MDLIEKHGVTEVARMVGVKPPSVCEWRQRGIPPDRCPALERATQGAYTCEQLRPDVIWHRVPDAQWPWHVGGRPMIDVTAKGAA